MTTAREFRLLAVAQVDEPGGAEVALLRLAPRLLRRGWKVTVTTPGDGAVAEAARALGCDTAALPVGGLSGGPAAAARAVAAWPQARRLAKAHDTVLLNGTAAGRLLPAVASTRCRTVLHVHDLVDRVPQHWRRADAVLAPALSLIHI